MLLLVYKKDEDRVKPTTKAKKYSYQMSNAEVRRLMAEIVKTTNLKNSKLEND